MGHPDERLEIACGPLQVRFATTPPAVELDFAEGPRGLALRFDPPAPFAPLLAGGPRVITRGDVKGRAAPAHRIEWLAFGRGQRDRRGDLGLRLALEVDAAGEGVTLETTLENRTPGALALEPLPVATGSLAAGEATPPALLPLRLWSDGAGNEESLLLETGPGPGCLWIGFVTGSAGYGRLRARPGGFVAASTGVAPLPSGATLRVDRLFVGRAGSRSDALDAWARRAGAEMESPMPARPRTLGPAADPGAVREARHRPGTGAASWRAELEALRDGLGESAQLSARGPALASAGIAHALRPGADALQLAVASQRLWLLDLPLPSGPEDVAHGPGPGRGSGRGADALGWQALLAGLAGGLVRVPETPPPYARALLPPLAREVSQVAPGVLRISLLGERVAVLLCNTGGEPRPLGLALADVGVRGPAHAYEFGHNEVLPTRGGVLAPRPVAPGGARLLALTPCADRPQVVGSSLHVGMGTAEVAALRSTPDGLVLVLRHRGEHAGDVWIAIPGEAAPRRIAVRFRDHAEIPVGPATPPPLDPPADPT